MVNIKECSCASFHTERKFRSGSDFLNLEKKLTTFDEFSEVSVKVKKLNVGFNERELACRICGARWRLIEPDFPFKGIWEKIKG